MDEQVSWQLSEDYALGYTTIRATNPEDPWGLLRVCTPFEEAGVLLEDAIIFLHTSLAA